MFAFLSTKYEQYNNRVKYFIQLSSKKSFKSVNEYQK